MDGKLGPGYPHNWEEIRKAVLERDGYKCSNNPSHKNAPLHVHHVVPISKGGTNELSNLITLCEDCHAKLHPHMDDGVIKIERIDGKEHISIDLDIRSDFNIRDEAVQLLISQITESPVDVREKLEDYVPESDEFQEYVINAKEDTIRVLAPAGSGKTQTIINRVLNNIKEGINPNRLLMLTFDNSAVLSINKKMSNQLGELNIEITPPEVKTLNAFGFSILRDYFSEEFKEIVPKYRQKRLFDEIKKVLREKSKEIYDVLPPNVDNNYYFEFFSLLKNETFDPRNFISQEVADYILQREEANAFFVDPNNRLLVTKMVQGILWLFQAFDAIIRHNGYMDFDDQKLRPYVLLHENPTNLEIIQGKFSEIIVDEFQDINKLDFELIKLIAHKSKLVVTGDDDQAIYGFRGCTPEYILNLENNLGRKVKTYKLRINYRSPKNIVSHSTALIRHNKWREEKDPISGRDRLAEIKVVSTLSAGLEAKYVVEYINKIRRENPGISYDKFAVLYRTNAQSLPLQVEFIINGIPYYVRDEDNIIINNSLEKLLGFLRLKLALSEKKYQHLKMQFYQFNPISSLLIQIRANNYLIYFQFNKIFLKL